MKAGFAYTIGRRHAAEQDPALRICQDSAGIYSDENVTIIAVADGKAGRNAPPAAVTAARVNIDTIIAFFRDPATWRIAEKNDFKERALRMLDSSLDTIAGGEEFRYEELRATVSAVAVRANGEFLALSIGDGTIVALDKEMNPSVLIPPYREGLRGRTVYTNDPDGARAHMAAWGGTLAQSEFLAFAVFTDGADYLTRRMVDGANILRTAAACTLFGSGNEYITEAISEIAEEHSKDDVALAVLTEESDAAFAAAKKVLLQTKAQKDTDDTEEDEETLTEPVEDAVAAAEALDEAADAEAPAAEETAEPEEDTAEDNTQPEETPAEEDETAGDEEEFEEPAEPTPAESVVLRAVFAEPLSAEELVEQGYIRKGRVLETTIPLIRTGRIRYENGKFAGNE